MTATLTGSPAGSEVERGSATGTADSGPAALDPMVRLGAGEPFGRGLRTEGESSTWNEEQRRVQVWEGRVMLEGTLTVPENSRGIVIMPAASSDEPRVRLGFLACELGAAGLATLLIDLLQADEEAGARSADHPWRRIGLLVRRLQCVTDWLAQDPGTWGLGVGYLGEGTEGAAELMAAARLPEVVQALVVSVGRPDHAGAALFYVRAPTLFLVGDGNLAALAMNREALQLLGCERRLEVIPGVRRPLVEPESMERVARLASDWFRHHLHAMGPCHAPSARCA